MRSRILSGSRRGRGLAVGRQRGAASVFAAVGLVAMIISMLLAINIGRLYYAQRDLQRQATLAAIAGAEISSGCRNGGTPGTLAAVTTQVTNSLTNNALPNSNPSGLLATIAGAPAVQLGWVNSTSGQSVTDDSGKTWTAPNDGLQHFLTLSQTEGDSHINAVRVNLSTSAPSPIGAFFGNNAVTLYASATAKQSAYASFGLGTSTVTLNAGLLNSLLSLLLGTNVNLSLLDYQNLASAQVNLAGLMVAAGVSDLNSLLNLQTSLPGALQYVGDALTAAGGATSGLAGGLVSGLAGQSYTPPSGSPATQNYFGQIFNTLGTTLNPTVSDALSAVPIIDGLNLLQALGQAASKGGTISLPLTLNTGLLNAGAFLSIIKPMQFAVGPAGYDPVGDTTGRPLTEAQSAQLSLQLRLGISVLSVVNINLGANISAANGTSILTNVSCPSSTSGTAQAQITTTTSLLTANLGTFTGSAGASSPATLTDGPVLSVLGLITINTSGVNTASTIPGTTVTQTGSAPFPDTFPAITSTSPLDTLVSTLLSSNLTINIIGLSIPVGGVLSAILTPITTLLDAVISPLLQLLGVGVGVSNVVLEGISTAQPVIVNTALPGTAQS